MQNCPLKFNQSRKKIVIENFEDTNEQCIASLVPVDKDIENNDYISERSKNIQNLDKEYNQELSNYLNNYNTYLLNKAMLKNSPPGSASQAQIALATDKSKEKFLESQKKLHEIQKNIEDNNKSTNDVISSQSDNIKNKAKKIREREKSIGEQQNLIEEKNKILNSRTRQIELGISKNIYKRNVMWFLVIINIILVLVVVGIIIFSGNKK